jgi:cell division protein FtsW (lipid II flippase)
MPAFNFKPQYLPPAEIHSRLLKLAALFLSLNAAMLSLAPVARSRSWDLSLLRWSHWGGLALWLLAAWLAQRQFTRHTPDADPYLLPIAALLAGWGMLSIWRLSNGFGLRQAAWLTVSMTVFLTGLRTPLNLDILRRYKYLILTSGLLLTALTLFFGTNPGGAGPRLWLGCCGLYLQPSEPLKLLLIIYLAAYFASRLPIRTHLLPLLFPTLLLTGLALTILLIQRDLGTASIFIFLYAAIVYLASAKRRLLGISLGLLAAAALTGYFTIDLIRLRIDAWLNPWADPSGNSYQIIQSILAVASGGIDGRGLGMGAPGLVPVAQSDFIFTTISEEFGLLGTFALFILLAILIVRGFIIAIRAGSNFRRLLAAGIVTYFGAQSILIIGGNLRLLPLTGVTLPFVSYGGSSLLTSFLALLILTQVSSELEAEPISLPQPGPYLHIAALLCIGLAAGTLANGWWAIWRADDLLARTDNPRRSIADRFVPRGSLLDRQNQAITITQGEAGHFTRLTLAPDLSPLIGYTHPIYGQAGLEQSLDPYLRGLQGLPALDIWWEHLLYGQPPAGLNVRLSLDLGIQAAADRLLGKHAGAIVLVNARSGEILASASHPTYNANLLDNLGETLTNAPGSPLVNRSMQVLYPSTAAVTPIFLAEYGTTSLTNAEQVQLFEKLRFYHTPDLRLPASPASPAGKTEPGLSPMQMSVAAAALSNAGLCPALQLVMAVDIPGQGWVVLPPDGRPEQCLDQQGVIELLKGIPGPFWQFTSQSKVGSGGAVTWLIGGTRPGWQGTPLGVVILLEEDAPGLAQSLGMDLLEAAIK